jgi:hypothetical protein
LHAVGSGMNPALRIRIFHVQWKYEAFGTFKLTTDATDEVRKKAWTIS